MAGGSGLTGDRNFENSVEYFRRGDAHRTIVYGVTREEVLDRLRVTNDAGWEDDWVVFPTRTVSMGLPPTWTRASRRSCEYY